VRAIVEGSGSVIAFVDVRDFVSDNVVWNGHDHVSVASYYRLYIAEALPENVEHAVYFDADILVVDTVDDLLLYRAEKPLAAVRHYSAKDEVRLWGDCGGDYFNAGILIMNLAALRECDAVERYERILLEENERILWHDQDVLNIAHRDEWEALAYYYNVNRSVIQAFGVKELNGVRIVHYDGWDKPWVPNRGRPFRSLWHQAYYSLYKRRHDADSFLSKVIWKMKCLKKSISDQVHDR